MFGAIIFLFLLIQVHGRDIHMGVGGLQVAKISYLDQRSLLAMAQVDLQ